MPLVAGDREDVPAAFGTLDDGEVLDEFERRFVQERIGRALHTEFVTGRQREPAALIAQLHLTVT